MSRERRGERIRKIMQDAYDNTERRLNEYGHAGFLVRDNGPEFGGHMTMTMKWEAKGAYVFEGKNCIGICDTDNASIAQYERVARLMAAAPDLLSIAERWAALDGGTWHVERYTREKAELLDDTRAAIAKAKVFQA